MEMEVIPIPIQVFSHSYFHDRLDFYSIRMGFPWDAYSQFIRLLNQSTRIHKIIKP